MVAALIRWHSVLSFIGKNTEKVVGYLRPAGGDPGLDHLQKFLTVCVSLSGLGPSETHEKLSTRQM